MGNMFDYLDWRGDLKFSQAGLNAVDNVILSELTYIDFEGIVPEKYSERIKLSQAAKKYAELHPRKKNMLGMLLSDELPELLEKSALTERFMDIELWGYVNEISREKESQFAALCWTLDSGDTYVCYRGTDDTIAGWKENLNMAFMFPVPAQEKAAAYLVKAAESCPERLTVGGHSKGGNLALYAASFAPQWVQARIMHVWSNDGPGFMPEVLLYEGYRRIRERACQIRPVSSVVGVLLETDCETLTVESSAHGPMQHDGQSWLIMGGGFIPAKEESFSSRQVDETTDSLIEGMTLEQRREFIETVFEAVYKTGARTLTELRSAGLKPKTWSAVLSSTEMDPEVKEQFLKSLMCSFHVDERIINFIFRENKENKNTGA